MIPRQPQHDNEWVRATDEALLRVCERWGARVGFKQRIADVLRLERNNSSFEEGRYALQSHFDFVVWRDGTPQFAVEFDEAHHRSDAAQQRRDAMKDRLCWQAGFPLVRAVDRSLKHLGRWVLIEWLIELWFVYHDVVDRDRRDADLRRLSEVPDSWGAEDLTDGHVRWMTEFSTPSKMDYTRMFAPRPGRPDLLDPFSDARERLELRKLQGRRVRSYWERPPKRSGWVRGTVLVDVGHDTMRSSKKMPSSTAGRAPSKLRPNKKHGAGPGLNLLCSERPASPLDTRWSHAPPKRRLLAVPCGLSSVRETG